jgi:acetyltransferase-like isoleucine patch superfamily enzyme
MIEQFLEYLRSHRGVRQVLRQIRCGWWRRRYGLRFVHPTFCLSSGCRISRDLVAGAYGFMNRNCTICPRVRLGSYVMFGPDVAITGADHRYDQVGTPIIFSGRPELPETRIEDDAWIGYRAIIMAGVTIGRGAIVAAGAVVTADVAPYAIVAGVPARPIRERFREDEILQHDKLFDLPSHGGPYCGSKTANRGKAA